MRLRDLVVGTLVATSPSFASFVTFESGQVRPLALSPDGTRLFATATPDNHLAILSIAADGTLSREASVPVGLEPVAVAARSNDEVWVVNHLSDSVSIVDVASDPPRVVRTLLVGDEPRDIVFAGPSRSRAFITCAHRGQNNPNDPQLIEEGIGRADVWVFDAGNLGASLGGDPLTIVTLFADTPRALAATPDGNTVYAAAFHSGNQTTALSEGLVCNGGQAAGPCIVDGGTMPGGLPAPNANTENVIGPETGLIVRFDQGSGQWRDPLARNWNPAVRFTLPDLDVFAIDAAANPPVATTSIAHVGTILFDMIVNPVSGKLYVTNTEARNEVRFEGPGILGTTVRGHLHEARVSVIQGTTVTPRHLNAHIDYDVAPSPPGTAEKSLATPLGMAISNDGTTLWVAAFGSGIVAALPTADLEAGTYVPSADDHVAVSGGGPTGLVLDESGDHLYVFTRFDHGVAVIDTTTHTEIQKHLLFNPEPAHVKAGRPVLYDARATSSNGEASCAACHVFGDFDSLGWDLGNPDDTVLNNPNPIEFNVFLDPDFHPMKGPMTTQSLRGMANHGPMHWRGDRTGGNDPGGSALDERQGFLKFIGAFEGLLGHDGPIPDADMEAFADFILDVSYPPNPIRALDDSLTTSQSAGRTIYFGPVTDSVRNCNGCHTLDRALGFFGTDGDSSFENEPQIFKIAHLRNAYQKVGMFGMPLVPFLKDGTAFLGDQVRGYGFLHDGTIDTVFRFLGATVFSLSSTERRQVESFVLAFDSELAPVVGQQVTLDATNAATTGPRIDLLLARADAEECDVVVKGTLDGEARGWLRTASGTFVADRAGDDALTDASLRALAATPAQSLTYTCTPPGSGTRIGVDRDDDGWRDRDELDAGTDPEDPASFPTGTTTTTLPAFTMIDTKRMVLRDQAKSRRIVFSSTRAPSTIVPPTPGSTGDPTLGGAQLTVYNPSLTPDIVRVSLPGGAWSEIAKPGKPFKGWRWTGDASQEIEAVLVKPGKIIVRGGRATWAYTLDEAAQGFVALRLGLGTATSWCTVARPKGFKGDRPGRFVGQRSNETTCPPTP